ncbi:MAG: Apolipoprotein N-acyltransferase [Verrucomicrobiota bacterium]
MNEFLQRHESRLRPALAIGAGLLLAAAFPKLGIAGLAWIAPGLLLFSAAGRSGKVAFRLGWLGGFAFHLAALHWLLAIPVKGFPILGWLALSAYAAVYPGLWVWLCWRLVPTSGDAVPVAGGGVRTPRPTEPLDITSWGQRVAWSLKCAVLWVALETLVSCLLTGFPWLALGVSQHKLGPLIQIASVTGVGGVSLLAVWFAVALAGDLVELTHRPDRFKQWKMICLLPLGLAGCVMFWGFRETSLGHQSKRVEQPIMLALVQPSIPQAMIWNPAEKTNRFAKLMQLSELVLATKPDVLVWPEAALPDLSAENFRAVTNLVATHKVWMVFGADDYELKPGAPRDSNRAADYAFYNSAFLLSPEGKVVSAYRKRRLVLFGEYIPLADWLPFLKWFTPIEGGFTAGREPVAFTLGEKGLRAGMLICFEDALAPTVRESAADADFLLNLTNDGWFGEGAQQFQHAAHSVFRAVENRRPVVRCTNNGLTCWVDESGFTHDLGVGDAADVYGPGFRVVKLPVPVSGSRAPTFYQQHGNWFGWGCVFVALGLVWVARRRASARNLHPPPQRD